MTCLGKMQAGSKKIIIKCLRGKRFITVKCKIIKSAIHLYTFACMNGGRRGRRGENDTERERQKSVGVYEEESQNVQWLFVHFSFRLAPLHHSHSRTHIFHANVYMWSMKRKEILLWLITISRYKDVCLNICINVLK